MRHIIPAVIVFSVPVLSVAQQKPSHVSPPTGWTCADKATAKGEKYQVCSPPAGQQGNPFFVWTREPKAK